MAEDGKEEFLAVASALNEKLEATSGSSTGGDSYDDVEQMWKSELAADGDGSALDSSGWYSSSAAYWESPIAPVTVDGVLGGLGFLSAPDIKCSRAFLATVRSAVPGLESTRVLDCGAGIGRVSKLLLVDEFDAVDLVEQSPKMVKKAKRFVLSPKVGDIFCAGLQEFEPAAASYDVVWVQWVLNYLTDADLLAFLRRARAALREGGVIVLKENVAESEAFVLDKDDSSITRSDAYFREVFEQAGLSVVAQAQQEDFPDDLFPVFMYALQ